MKRIKIYLYIGIMSFCTSCSDFLDKVPDERTQLDSPDKVSALLVNAYPKVSYAAIVNTRCDYITDFGSVYSGAQPGALFSFMGENFLWKDVIEKPALIQCIIKSQLIESNPYQSFPIHQQ